MNFSKSIFKFVIVFILTLSFSNISNSVEKNYYKDLITDWSRIFPDSNRNAAGPKFFKHILNKDIKSFGKLMNESHQSYAKDFEASTEDVDSIVERSKISGAEGARLTGGGFGGFTVSLIHKNNYDEWQKNMHKYYDNKNIFEV